MTTELNKAKIKVIALGWFGTLMDERAGLKWSLSRMIGRERGRVDLDAMASAWLEEAHSLFSGSYEPWPDLMALALTSVCQGFKVSCPVDAADEMREWVRSWPFYDDHHWIGRLGRRFRVAIITQLDRDTLGPCLPGVARTLDDWVTTDMSHCYKPARDYFRLLKVQLKLGRPESLVIVSADKETDLEPAKEFGYQTLHIDRSESENRFTLADLVTLLG